MRQNTALNLLNQDMEEVQFTLKERFGVCMEKGVNVPCEISQEKHSDEYISCST